jgi:hypothetical protein
MSNMIVKFTELGGTSRGLFHGIMHTFAGSDSDKSHTSQALSRSRVSFDEYISKNVSAPVPV